MARIETAMGAVRAAIQKGAPVAEVRHQISALDTLFTDAEQVLAPEQTSSTSAFVGALTILLRAVLEALLVVIALVDRKSVVSGKSVSVGVDLGGGSTIKKKYRIEDRPIR